jgi:hypothetical protein
MEANRNSAEAQETNSVTLFGESDLVRNCVFQILKNYPEGGHAAVMTQLRKSSAMGRQFWFPPREESQRYNSTKGQIVELLESLLKTLLQKSHWSH